MKRTRIYSLYWLVAMLALATSACGGSTINEAEAPPTIAPVTAVPTKAPTEAPTAVPTAVPPTEVPPVAQPQPASGACDPDAVIERLYIDLPPEQFVFVYMGTFVPGQGMVLQLSIWVVDYLVDPNVSNDPNALLNNAGTALETGLSAASYIEHFDPCVGELFLVMNPIVVDRNYNGWISFSIPTGVLPETVDLYDSDTTAIIDQYLQLSYVRDQQPAPLGSPPAAACDWETVWMELEASFVPQSNGNTAVFFVRDDHGNNVWVYLDNSNIALAPQDHFEDQVNQVLNEIACLHPAPDNLILFVVGQDGAIGFSGRLPREGIEAADLDQFVSFP